MIGYESFSNVIGVDTEWGFRDGLINYESAFEPVVFCAVEHRAGARHVFWGRDVQIAQYLTDHADDLFVAHNAVAEMGYLLRLGFNIPLHWYDTFVEERHRTNQPAPPKASLTASLHRWGLPHLTPTVKEELRQRILHLQFDINDPATRTEIAEYCLSDCDGCLALFEAQTR